MNEIKQIDNLYITTMLRRLDYKITEIFAVYNLNSLNKNKMEFYKLLRLINYMEANAYKLEEFKVVSDLLKSIKNKICGTIKFLRNNLPKLLDENDYLLIMPEIIDEAIRQINEYRTNINKL